MGGLSPPLLATDLLAAVESLTFLPSKEAKCCSRASRRLLGACCDRKHSQLQPGIQETSRENINTITKQWWAIQLWGESHQIHQRIQCEVNQFMYLITRIISSPGHQSPTTDRWLHSSQNATLDESNICVGWCTAPRRFQQARPCWIGRV